MAYLREIHANIAALGALTDLGFCVGCYRGSPCCPSGEAIRPTAKLLTKDEARMIAANITKPPINRTARSLICQSSRRA